MHQHLATIIDWHPHWKIAIAAIVGTLAATVDAVAKTELWEDIGLKGLLIAALVFVVRLLLKQQAEHKAERDKREERLLEALNKSADSMDQLTSLTKEQTDYFKTVTRDIVTERLHGKPRLPNDAD